MEYPRCSAMEDSHDKKGKKEEHERRKGGKQRYHHDGDDDNDGERDSTANCEWIRIVMRGWRKEEEEDDDKDDFPLRKCANERDHL